ncbi:MAG: hypothetical protein JWR22_3026 [Herminiimonas sp.]|nr:hypothetical protein [Herminiimonas sp.]
MAWNNLQSNGSGAVARAPLPTLRLIDKDLQSTAETPNRDLYFALSRCTPSLEARTKAKDLLRTSLQGFGDLHTVLDDDLPTDFDDLEQWSLASVAQAGADYQAYLAARKQGEPRRYFPTRSHALHFLKAVAPTKLVDGSWLYGLARQWDDPAFTPLVQTYLDELGNGIPEQNHVVIYRRLLSANGCGNWQSLPDDYFAQGAVQLALAHSAEEFLPEIIGFNLGYEQLPLHLLITAYELDELGIDPTYFTLHVTVDNLVTGHARMALDALSTCDRGSLSTREFQERVRRGYRLNNVGVSTTAAIAAFDLEHEVIACLTAKAVVGQHVHSNYCRFDGRAVNDWLSDPAAIPEFLATLQRRGWIQRHQDPTNSRFWRLVHGDRASMFGVFMPNELQLIYDWIAGDTANGASYLMTATTTTDAKDIRQPSVRVTPFRTQRRSGAAVSALQASEAKPRSARGLLRLPSEHRAVAAGERDIDSQSALSAAGFRFELRDLEEKLAAASSREEMAAILVPLLSPARHHTPQGLMATRVFAQLLAFAGA